MMVALRYPSETGCDHLQLQGVKVSVNSSQGWVNHDLVGGGSKGQSYLCSPAQILTTPTV